MLVAIFSEWPSENDYWRLVKNVSGEDVQVRATFTFSLQGRCPHSSKLLRRCHAIELIRAPFFTLPHLPAQRHLLSQLF